MSLTSILKSFPDVRKMVPNHKPQLTDMSGRILGAADWKTSILVPSIGKSHEAGTIGTAFDYLARAILTRKVGRDKTERRRPVAQESLNVLPQALNGYEQTLLYEQDETIRKERRAGAELALRDEYELLQYMWDRLEQAMSVTEEFIDGEIPLETLASHMLFMARLDTVFRSGSIVVVDEFLIQKYGKTYFAQKSTVSATELLANVTQLAVIFEQAFTGVPMHQLSLNPIFQPYSSAVGGADADFVFDSTLMDIKSTNKLAYSTEDIAQVLGYTAMARAIGIEIDRVGIYFARYGLCAMLRLSAIVDRDEFMHDYLQAILRAAGHEDGYCP